MGSMKELEYCMDEIDDDLPITAQSSSVAIDKNDQTLESLINSQSSSGFWGKDALNSIKKCLSTTEKSALDKIFNSAQKDV